GVTADAHAAALAWTPPGFKEFDAGRAGVEDAGAEPEADAVAPEAVADAEASAGPGDARPRGEGGPHSAAAAPTKNAPGALGGGLEAPASPGPQ
ncbi:MAG: hypothetical protein OXU64_14285, partial [Gemmatimonadota bacterium]|nr:hypothetical protein [Gemmatimonadota bacterium]